LPTPLKVQLEHWQRSQSRTGSGLPGGSMVTGGGPLPPQAAAQQSAAKPKKSRDCADATVGCRLLLISQPPDRTRGHQRAQYR
jgi:hypothetical protein